MKKSIKFLSLVFALVIGVSAFAQEAAPAVEPQVTVLAQEATPAVEPQVTVLDQEDGSKLVALITVEEAFSVAINQRAQIAQAYLASVKAQQEAAEADKASFDEKIAQQRNALNVVNMYLNIVFSTDGVNEYAYDSENQTVYLKVGTAKDIFVRVLAKRGLLDRARQQATDDQEKARLEAQYQLLQQALDFVYKMDPKRQYEFNADNGVIYLKASAEEAAQILESLKK